MSNQKDMSYRPRVPNNIHNNDRGWKCHGGNKYIKIDLYHTLSALETCAIDHGEAEKWPHRPPGMKT